MGRCPGVHLADAMLGGQKSKTEQQGFAEQREASHIESVTWF